LVKTVPGKTKEAITAVESEWIKNPNAERLPLDYEFMDNRYAMLQQKQEQLKNVSSAFAVVAISIATLGLFNLATYNISRRRKEVSIRKVLGANLLQLFLHLNRPFFRIFIIANMLAIPISFLLLKKWLQNFAYQIEISIWPFIIASVSILIIMFITLSVQSIRAATANPMDSLRDE
jgi:putative ABC transport system permease protein